MKKLLYVIQNYRFFSGRGFVIGGHIAHIIGIVEAFQHLGYEVVIASYERVPFWENPVRYLDFKTTELPFTRINKVGRQWYLTRQLIEFVEREQPDLLYVRWSTNLFIRRLKRKFANLPIVMECNTPSQMNVGVDRIMRPSFFRNRLARILDANNIGAATLITTVSDETRTFLLERHPRLNPDRIIACPNGVDVNRFREQAVNMRSVYGIPKDAVVIGWSGNFQYWHRVDLLIEAFQEMDREHTFLMIIGTGNTEFEQELKSLAGHHCPERIIFTGPIQFDRMPTYLSSCDILVSPQSNSFSRGFHGSPTKLYEYLAMGRAVIGSRIGQIARVIEHGRNGMLFEPDSKADLVDILKTMVEDKSLRSRLGEQARQDAQRSHSWKASAYRMLDRLETVTYTG